MSDAMTPRDRLIVGRPGMSLQEARELMHKHRIEKLPLVEEDAVLRGLITLRDISLTELFPRSSRDKEGRQRVAAAVGVNEDYVGRTTAKHSMDVASLIGKLLKQDDVDALQEGVKIPPGGRMPLGLAHMRFRFCTDDVRVARIGMFFELVLFRICSADERNTRQHHDTSGRGENWP